MSDRQTKPVTDGRSPHRIPRPRSLAEALGGPSSQSIISGKKGPSPERNSYRGTSENRGDNHHDGPETPDRQRQLGMDAASQDGRSYETKSTQPSNWHREPQMRSGFTQCPVNVPIKFRAKRMDSTPEQMKLEFDIFPSLALGQVWWKGKGPL